jgi:hypothetical protein
VSALAERLIAVHDALAEADFPHAFGGAIALGYCTLEPRGTRDLDVNVFVTLDRVKQVFAALPQAVTVTALDLEKAERDGQVRVWWDQTPVDVFFNVLPFHSEVARNVRQVSFAERTIPVLGCTALAVFKAMFDRTKDWADIEAMAATDALDVRVACERVASLLGRNHAGYLRLLATLESHPGPSPPLPRLL